MYEKYAVRKCEPNIRYFRKENTIQCENSVKWNAIVSKCSGQNLRLATRPYHSELPNAYAEINNFCRFVISVKISTRILIKVWSLWSYNFEQTLILPLIYNSDKDWSKFDQTRSNFKSREPYKVYPARFTVLYSISR